MDTENLPAAGDEPVGMLAQIASLRDNATKSLARMKTREAELAALIPSHENGAVSARFDERGLVSHLTIDPQLRAGLDGAGLQRDISIAIANAERPAPEPTVGTDNPEEGLGLITSILSGLTSGLSTEPVLYSNDFETVTITTMWGELLAVDCSEAWLASASESSISDEIVRVANLALLADDPLQKRKR